MDNKTDEADFDFSWLYDSWYERVSNALYATSKEVTGRGYELDKMGWAVHHCLELRNTLFDKSNTLEDRKRLAGAFEVRFGKLEKILTEYKLNNAKNKRGQMGKVKEQLQEAQYLSIRTKRLKDVEIILRDATAELNMMMGGVPIDFVELHDKLEKAYEQIKEIRTK